MCFNLYYKHAFKRDTLPNYSGCIIHAYTLCPVEVHVEINICMYMFVYIVVAALHGHCNYYVDPRRACAARVVSGHISPMERLFVLKTLSRTQRATKVKNLWFSLKPLRCRDPALPPLYGQAYSRPFFHAYFSCIYAHDTPPSVRRGFRVLFIISVF